MSNPDNCRVNESIYPWNTTINGVPHKFNLQVFDSIHEGGEASFPILNLNGIGEGSFSASVAPRILGPNVISPIMPFRGELELTPANIDRIATEVPLAIAYEGIKRVNELHGSSYKSIDMIARSQGGAPGIRAASTDPELFNKLALIMPFGLNKELLGGTEKERRDEIVKRLVITSLRGNFFDYGNLRSSMEVGAYMARSAVGRELIPSLDAALTFDLTEELIELAETKDVAVFVGQRDPLFPLSELEVALRGSKASVMPIKGTHATPGSRSGQRHLRAAAAWLRPKNLTLND